MIIPIASLYLLSTMADGVLAFATAADVGFADLRVRGGGGGGPWTWRCGSVEGHLQFSIMLRRGPGCFLGLGGYDGGGGKMSKWYGNGDVWRRRGRDIDWWRVEKSGSLGGR